MFKSKTFSAFALISGASSLFGIQQIVRGNEKFYKEILMPAVHYSVDGETAHKIAVKCAKYGFVPKNKSTQKALEITVFGKHFKNPLGIAAGFDKHAEAISGLHKTGFGFVEVGSITPSPQEGNAKPRVFRLNEDKCVINRYGFNSCGHDIAKKRIEEWHQKTQNQSVKPVLGINLGANKLSENRVNDYVKGIHELGHLADYVVINISSPNTAGLRNLQGKKNLLSLCSEVKKAVDNLQCKPAILLKLAPDLNEQDVTDIIDVIQTKTSHIDGLIISNTTISRPSSLRSIHKDEMGGLSGPVLSQMSTELIKEFYNLTNGQIPIIGVGGISNGQDAYDKIKAGASLVQIYTSFVYSGPPIVSKINGELSELLKSDGFTSIKEAVGSGCDNRR